MFPFKQKYIKCIKRHKTHFEETEKASEPDPDMARELELSDHEFKTALTNILQTPMEW